MAFTFRNIIVTSIPALAAIFGFLWFTRKKKQDAIEDKPKDKPKSVAKPKEPDVRPKENVNPVEKKEQSVLSASDIAGDQLPLGTSTLLNMAVVEDTSKSVLKPQQDAKPEVSSEEKAKTPSKNDSLQLQSQSPLATSTPFNGHSTQEAAVLNNNKQAEEPVEETISAEVQSVVFAKPNVDEEIGQGDRSRSTDLHYRAPRSTDASNSPVPNEVTISKSQPSPTPSPELTVRQSESKSESDSSVCDSKDQEPATNGKVTSDSTDNGNASTDSDDVTLSESDNSQEQNEPPASPASVSDETSERKDDDVTDDVTDEVTSEVTGEVTEVNEMSSPATSPVQTPPNGVNGSHSDAQSEHSADSGQGSSVGPTETSDQSETAIAQDPNAEVEYAFDFPAEMCGLLIGRRGVNIKDLKDRSRCEISVRDKLYNIEYKLIVLKGSQKSIDMALDIVKKRFPPHKFGPIDFSPVPSTDNPTQVTDMMQVPAPPLQLALPANTCDVNVSSVVAPNHLFLQQITHPSFAVLDKLNSDMFMCYNNQDSIVPQLPRPIDVGIICAAPMFNGWYRALVVNVYEDSDEVDIKFVDYGGYSKVQACLLRQIRSDFTVLPFQAIECYMANIVPPTDSDAGFPIEANAVLEELVHHQILQADVLGYEQDGVPYVLLFQTLPTGNVRVINMELVNRGVARWVEQQL